MEKTMTDGSGSQAAEPLALVDSTKACLVATEDLRSVGPEASSPLRTLTDKGLREVPVPGGDVVEVGRSETVTEEFQGRHGCTPSSLAFEQTEEAPTIYAPSLLPPQQPQLLQAPKTVERDSAISNAQKFTETGGGGGNTAGATTAITTGVTAGAAGAARVSPGSNRRMPRLQTVVRRIGSTLSGGGGHKLRHQERKKDFLKRYLKKFDAEEIEVLKKVYKELSARNPGAGIDKETFLQYIPLPGLWGERLFQRFDYKCLGVVDYDEFLIGMAVCCRGTKCERIHVLFQVFDLNGDGVLQKDELVAMLSNLPNLDRYVKNQARHEAVSRCLTKSTMDNSSVAALVSKSSSSTTSGGQLVLGATSEHGEVRNSTGGFADSESKLTQRLSSPGQPRGTLSNAGDTAIGVGTIPTHQTEKVELPRGIAMSEGALLSRAPDNDDFLVMGYRADLDFDDDDDDEDEDDDKDGDGVNLNEDHESGEDNGKDREEEQDSRTESDDGESDDSGIETDFEGAPSEWNVLKESLRKGSIARHQDDHYYCCYDKETLSVLGGGGGGEAYLESESEEGSIVGRGPHTRCRRRFETGSLSREADRSMTIGEASIGSVLGSVGADRGCLRVGSDSASQGCGSLRKESTLSAFTEDFSSLLILRPSIPATTEAVLQQQKNTKKKNIDDAAASQASHQKTEQQPRLEQGGTDTTSIPCNSVVVSPLEMATLVGTKTAVSSDASVDMVLSELAPAVIRPSGPLDTTTIEGEQQEKKLRMTMGEEGGLSSPTSVVEGQRERSGSNADTWRRTWLSSSSSSALAPGAGDDGLVGRGHAIGGGSMSNGLPSTCPSNTAVQRNRGATITGGIVDLSGHTTNGNDATTMIDVEAFVDKIIEECEFSESDCLNFVEFKTWLERNDALLAMFTDCLDEEVWGLRGKALYRRANNCKETQCFNGSRYIVDSGGAVNDLRRKKGVVEIRPDSFYKVKRLFTIPARGRGVFPQQLASGDGRHNNRGGATGSISVFPPSSLVSKLEPPRKKSSSGMGISSAAGASGESTGVTPGATPGATPAGHDIGSSLILLPPATLRSSASSCQQHNEPASTVTAAVPTAPGGTGGLPASDTITKPTVERPVNSGNLAWGGAATPSQQGLAPQAEDATMNDHKQRRSSGILLSATVAKRDTGQMQTITETETEVGTAANPSPVLPHPEFDVRHLETATPPPLMGTRPRHCSSWTSSCVSLLGAGSGVFPENQDKLLACPACGSLLVVCPRCQRRFPSLRLDYGMVVVECRCCVEEKVHPFHQCWHCQWSFAKAAELVDECESLKEGILYKIGRHTHKWRRRYFVLIDNMLYYYGRKEDTKPRGFLFLEGCFVEIIRPPDRTHTGQQQQYQAGHPKLLQNPPFAVGGEGCNGEKPSLGSSVGSTGLGASSRDGGAMAPTIMAASLFTKLSGAAAGGSTGGKYGFSIVHGQGKIPRRDLYASSEVERSEWVTALQHAMNQHSVEQLYTLGEEVGMGKFSKVYAATCCGSGDDDDTAPGSSSTTVSSGGGRQKVAIKVIDKGKIRDNEREREMLRSEIAILRLLRHPNIISFREIIDSRTHIHIVMEYVQGGALHALLQKRGRLPELYVNRIIFQLLSAVAYLHKCGIIHRDIKPENILLTDNTADANIKLTDFGLSCICGPSELVTQPCGTLAYVAPEVLTLQGYNHKVDVWACGVTMYYLLRGQLPFPIWTPPKATADPVSSTAPQYLPGTVTFDGSLWSSVSSSAKDFIRKLLHSVPEKRISASEALQHIWIKNPTAVMTGEAEPDPEELPTVMAPVLKKKGDKDNDKGGTDQSCGATKAVAGPTSQPPQKLVAAVESQPRGGPPSVTGKAVDSDAPQAEILRGLRAGEKEKDEGVPSSKGVTPSSPRETRIRSTIANVTQSLAPPNSVFNPSHSPDFLATTTDVHYFSADS